MAKKKTKKIKIKKTFVTAQTRVVCKELDDFSPVYNSAVHYAYLHLSQGAKLLDLDKVVQKRYNLKKRVINSVLVEVKEMASSKREKALLDIPMLQAKLEKVKEKRDLVKNSCVLKLPPRDITFSKKIQRRNKNQYVHYSQMPLQDRNMVLLRLNRQVDGLEKRINNLINISKMDYPPVCFGTKKLLRKRNTLTTKEEILEWTEEWSDKRSSNIYLVGSGDKIGGNEDCTATINADNSVDLRISIFKDKEKAIIIKNITLEHKHNDWIAEINKANKECIISRNWIANTMEMQAKNKDKKDEITKLRRKERKEQKLKDNGSSGITYRFHRDERGWRMMVTLPGNPLIEATDFSNGCVSIDVNNGFVSVAIIDSKGELVKQFDKKMIVYGKTTGQREAVIHFVCNKIAKLAKELGLPLIMEDLDFSVKKRDLVSLGAKQARMLSAFPYAMFTRIMKCHVASKGVAFKTVNPAYTSIQGSLIAVKNGLTIHGGAAMVIGRRAMGIVESIPVIARLNTGHAVIDVSLAGQCNKTTSKAKKDIKGTRRVNDWFQVGVLTKKAMHVARTAAKSIRGDPRMGAPMSLLRVKPPGETSPVCEGLVRLRLVVKNLNEQI